MSDNGVDKTNGDEKEVAKSVTPEDFKGSSAQVAKSPQQIFLRQNCRGEVFGLAQLGSKDHWESIIKKTIL